MGLLTSDDADLEHRSCDKRPRDCAVSCASFASSAAPQPDDGIVGLHGELVSDFVASRNQATSQSSVKCLAPYLLQLFGYGMAALAVWGGGVAPAGFGPQVGRWFDSGILDASPHALLERCCTRATCLLRRWALPPREQGVANQAPRCGRAPNQRVQLAVLPPS